MYIVCGLLLIKADNRGALSSPAITFSIRGLSIIGGLLCLLDASDDIFCSLFTLLPAQRIVETRITIKNVFILFPFQMNSKVDFYLFIM